MKYKYQNIDTKTMEGEMDKIMIGEHLKYKLIQALAVAIEAGVGLTLTNEQCHWLMDREYEFDETRESLMIQINKVSELEEELRLWKMVANHCAEEGNIPIDEYVELIKSEELS